jgi:hypothetical protein
MPPNRIQKSKLGKRIFVSSMTRGIQSTAIDRQQSLLTGCVTVLGTLVSADFCDYRHGQMGFDGSFLGLIILKTLKVSPQQPTKSA